MKKRLFIAINIPEKIKDRIEGKIVSLREISRGEKKIRRSFQNDIRFLDRSNWHITITFLGYQEDLALAPIVKSMKSAAENFSAPEIEFTDISYGPKDGPKRMIWLNGSEKTADQLAGIKNTLEDSLIDNGVRFKQEHRKMRVHVTLARFQPTRDLPEMRISTDQNVNNISVNLRSNPRKSAYKP